ncbi:hypothetical protein dsx2_1525 [Desulfovibrio sp. X2]|uniref:hypothetical protein n=1 Tax=Desulfovibrio sp. X2 TaxID=941449 RepID=UPI000358AC70|nr:hypothetical protein [Desulfovibrio sp. X2]EPR44566.1 hypothetical protein dsx2_1525 [Desulfovibrio sp. X2]
MNIVRQTLSALSDLARRSPATACRLLKSARARLASPARAVLSLPARAARGAGARIAALIRRVRAAAIGGWRGVMAGLRGEGRP